MYKEQVLESGLVAYLVLIGTACNFLLLLMPHSLHKSSRDNEVSRGLLELDVDSVYIESNGLVPLGRDNEPDRFGSMF